MKRRTMSIWWEFRNRIPVSKKEQQRNAMILLVELRIDNSSSHHIIIKVESRERRIRRKLFHTDLEL
jgi:hypothetical protein